MAMYCMQCGTSLPHDAKFCYKCGTPVKISPEPSSHIHSNGDINTDTSLAESLQSGWWDWFSMKEHELLNGEKLILSKNANAVIKLNEYGLHKLHAGVLLRFIGMGGKEAIGGRLHLTNYRLVFKAHSVNRLRDSLSIFLTTIEDVKDASKFAMRKIEIRTQAQTFEFVVWGIPTFIALIHSTKGNIDQKQEEFIKIEASLHPEKCSSRLKSHEAVNKILVTADTLINALATGPNPASISGILNLLELLDKDESSR